MHGLNEPNRIVVDPDKPPPKSAAEIAMLNIQHRCVGGVVKTLPQMNYHPMYVVQGIKLIKEMVK